MGHGKNKSFGRLIAVRAFEGTLSTFRTDRTAVLVAVALVVVSLLIQCIANGWQAMMAEWGNALLFTLLPIAVVGSVIFLWNLWIAPAAIAFETARKALAEVEASRTQAATTAPEVLGRLTQIEQRLRDTRECLLATGREAWLRSKFGEFCARAADARDRWERMQPTAIANGTYSHAFHGERAKWQAAVNGAIAIAQEVFENFDATRKVYDPEGVWPASPIESELKDDKSKLEYRILHLQNVEAMKILTTAEEQFPKAIEGSKIAAASVGNPRGLLHKL